jgi:hypothetical protein
MTVQELIQQLQTLPQDKKVVLSHTDHTDFLYTTELVKESINEEQYWNEELDSEDKEFEDSLEDVVIINCRFW